MNFSLILNNIKKNFNYFIDKIEEDKIRSLVNLIHTYKDKNIYFAGVGKSGNIAIHLADLLKSVCLNSFTLNIMNLTHGDLGCVKDDSLVILLSKSGNTKEILDIVDLIKCKKILICSNEKAKIKSKVDNTYIVPMIDECDLSFDLIPSNSISNTIIYFNIVMNLYIDSSMLSLEDYKCNHPAGDIGFKTKKVKDFISNDIYICRNLNLTVKEIIEIMNDNRMGIVFESSSDSKNIFYGILTNKDVIKILSTDINIMDTSIQKYINTSPFIIENSNDLIINHIDQIKKYKYFRFIPVIDNGIFVGIINNSKILKFI